MWWVSGNQPSLFRLFSAASFPATGTLVQMWVQSEFCKNIFHQNVSRYGLGSLSWQLSVKANIARKDNQTTSGEGNWREIKYVIHFSRTLFLSFCTSTDEFDLIQSSYEICWNVTARAIWQWAWGSFQPFYQPDSGACVPSWSPAVQLQE